jgi:class 3 adenylate cyclase
MRHLLPENLQAWAGVTDYDPRTTLAIVFTDIIDSTVLARTVGDREMFDMLIKHFEAARMFCIHHDGFEIKLIGDAYMVVFRTADAALQFALDLLGHTGDERIAIRVGIHVGQVRIKDNDIYGLQVNLAERLSHAEVPGETGIFLSTSVKRDIDSEHGTNQNDFRFRVLSTTKLKGFDRREEAWQVITPEIRRARRHRLAEKTRQEEEARRKSATILIPVEAPKVTLPDPPRYDPGPRRLYDVGPQYPTRLKSK